MIDRVVLSKNIELDIDKFDDRSFHLTEYKAITANDVELIKYCYVCNMKGIRIIYYIDTQKLIVDGRFINLSEFKNKVDNLDKISEGKMLEKILTETEREPIPYAIDNDIDDCMIELDDSFQPLSKEPIIETTTETYIEDLETVLELINDKILSLTGTKQDIRDFKVLHIDPCFNLPTEHFNEYIIIFNLIFQYEGLNKHYTNYTLENNKPLYSSFQVKTKAQYRDNTESNYTVNFYNKIDQLINSMTKEQKYKNRVTDNDLDLAYNVLRLEVKTGYQYLQKICGKFNINKKEIPFRDFLDIDLCAYIIKEMYMKFIDKQGKFVFGKLKTMHCGT